MSLSPVAFVGAYFDLCVTTDPLPDANLQYMAWNIHVKIHRYQLNHSARAVDALAHAEQPLVAKMRAAARADHGLVEIDGRRIPARDLNLAIWRSFVGKGSPADIALTLRLAIRYKVTDVMKLRAFCEQYLGLDCSGFVANYANSQLGMTFDVANTASTSFAPLGKRRASIDDVRPLDVLVWSHTNHVAIIDALDEDRIRFERMKSASPKLGSLVCTVAESNGRRGLGYCGYTVQSVNVATGEFTVKRHDDATTWKVWIASL